VLGALAGINLVSGPGLLDYLLTQSPEKLLLDHEACGVALRLSAGLGEADDDPAGLIAALCAAGEVLSHPHTRAHWRKVVSLPSPLVDRESYGDWEAAGRTTAWDRARTENARRARLPSSPEGGSFDELDELMRAEAARCGLDRLPA
jgi:trimethylamine--corrinoid protein Co-methyltransferase